MDSRRHTIGVTTLPTLRANPPGQGSPPRRPGQPLTLGRQLGPMMVRGAGAVAGLGLTAVLVRTLDDATVAQWLVVQAFVLITVATIGMPASDLIVRRATLSAHRVLPLHGPTSAFSLRVAAVAVAVASLAAMLVGFGLAGLGLELGMSQRSGLDGLTVVAIAIWVGAAVLQTVVAGVLRALSRPEVAELVLGPIRPLALLVLVSGAVAVTSPLDLTVIALLAAVSATVAASPVIVFCRNERETGPPVSTDGIGREAGLLSLAGAASSLLNRAALWTLAFRATTLSETVDLGLALQAMAVVGLPLVAINAQLGPVVASAEPHRSAEAAERVGVEMRQLAWLGTKLIAGFLVVHLITGRLYLTAIFGADHVEAYWPIVLLCLGQLGRAALGSGGVLLKMTANTGRPAAINLIGSGVGVALTWLAAPSLGASGAAAAITTVVLGQSWLLRRSAMALTTVDPSILGRRVAPAPSDDGR